MTRAVVPSLPRGERLGTVRGGAAANRPNPSVVDQRDVRRENPPKVPSPTGHSIARGVLHAGRAPPVGCSRDGRRYDLSAIRRARAALGTSARAAGEGVLVGGSQALRVAAPGARGAKKTWRARRGTDRVDRDRVRP